MAQFQLPEASELAEAIMAHWRSQHAAATDAQDTEAARTDDTLLRVWMSYDEDAEGGPFVLRFDESLESDQIGFGLIDLADNPEGDWQEEEVATIARLLVSKCYRWALDRGLVS